MSWVGIPTYMYSCTCRDAVGGGNIENMQYAHHIEISRKVDEKEKERKRDEEVTRTHHVQTPGAKDTMMHTMVHATNVQAESRVQGQGKCK